MEIGLYSNTHGLAARNGAAFYLNHTPFEEMRPVAVAQQAERNGFHSIWFPDHVCMPIDSGSNHPSGKRPYQPHHNFLDGAVVMGAVAAATSRIKLGTAVLIAPYRHPLSDARQLATVDLLSGGRLLFGVGCGWLREEFDAIGKDYALRNSVTEECLQIYKRAWTDAEVSFAGEHYRFENVSMDPKPAQTPHPPILFGGNTPMGARRAIRHCDGLFPLFFDLDFDANLYAPLQEIVRSEADTLGRDTAGFNMIAAAWARITDANDPQSSLSPHHTCTGTAEQILEHLEALANAGYSLVVCMMMCPSGSLSELEEQIQRFGEEVIPEARSFKPAGDWKIMA